MRRTYNNTSIAVLCGLFGRSRQAWYDHQYRYDGHSLEEGLIIGWVSAIRANLTRVGGVKLLHMLKESFNEHGITMGRDAFFILLRKNGLLVQVKKRYVTTTQSQHRFRKWPDLVQRSRAVMAEQIWVSDITYLRTQKGFVYLFLVTDAYSRKIVGYHLSQSLSASGCISAMQKAIRARVYPLRPLIHHSDRGIQYCCDGYVQILQERGISISMTQTGSPYDNAIAERVNGILKQEFGLYKTFNGYSQASAQVCTAIARYNNLRPHLSCGMNTPERTHTDEYKNREEQCKANSV